jgi:hypothetical protein
MTIFIFFIYSATSIIEAFDTFENRLSLVCNQDNTSFGINTSDICTDDDNTTVPRSSILTGTQNKLIEISYKINIFIVLLKINHKLKYQLRLMIMTKCNLNWNDIL